MAGFADSMRNEFGHVSAMIADRPEVVFEKRKAETKRGAAAPQIISGVCRPIVAACIAPLPEAPYGGAPRSEEHTSELQSH